AAGGRLGKTGGGGPAVFVFPRARRPSRSAPGAGPPTSRGRRGNPGAPPPVTPARGRHLVPPTTAPPKRRRGFLHRVEAAVDPAMAGAEVRAPASIRTRVGRGE